jgi:hypothetical protein
MLMLPPPLGLPLETSIDPAGTTLLRSTSAVLTDVADRLSAALAEEDQINRSSIAAIVKQRIPREHRGIVSDGANFADPDL